MATKNRLQECITPAQMNLIFNTRRFWREMAAWTRVYYRSKYFGVGDADEAFKRLYLLPDKFGESFQLIFGSEFAADYTLLLQQHVIILRELISAHIDGNVDQVNENVARLYQNGYDRATFLAGMNPFWTATQWRNLIVAYLQYTIEEANTFASSDHGASIDWYERIIAQTHLIGDYYAQGLFNFMLNSQQVSNIQRRIHPQQNDTPEEDICITYNQMNAIYYMRMFWFELTSWIRAMTVVILEEIGEPENISARLDVVFNEYKAAFSPFFDNETAEEYIQLIRNYIQLIFDLIYAQKAGEPDAIRRIIQSIEQNINERAAFLASVNPNFDQNEWKTLLTNYTRYTYEEITSYLAGDHAKSLDAYSRLLDLSQTLGENFSYGFLFAPADI